MAAVSKIINDPVYGFISIDHPLLLQVIAHPYFQRLRRIQQMAFANLVYPGAVHTRLHHALGAYHLMCNALAVLKSKGFDIGPEEELGAKIAILLHDVGHGPFSHALENTLIENVHHEKLSLQIMHFLNQTFDGRLKTAIDIFTGQHPKKFLHQLVTGQLDVDRMDYLNRDSFFTGVSEGVIGYDRIIKMLTVHNGELMVEEKGIYSIEKFLVSRRLMYWQVYLHKTVVSAESMIIQIIRRAKALTAGGRKISSSSAVLDYFLEAGQKDAEEYLSRFCLLDDYDVMSAIKHWMFHEDKVLSMLCRFLINRRLLKVKMQAVPFTQELVRTYRDGVCRSFDLSPEEAAFFVFTGEHANTTYNTEDERICILFKDGSTRDISKVDNALIHHSLSSEVKKFYICYLV
jgi:uncharacterized protein